MMKKQHFKFTALCMLGLGMSQMALAETAPRQTLPSFPAQDIPAMCNAKIADVQKQLKKFVPAFLNITFYKELQKTCSAKYCI